MFFFKHWTSYVVAQCLLFQRVLFLFFDSFFGSNVFLPFLTFFWFEGNFSLFDPFFCPHRTREQGNFGGKKKALFKKQGGGARGNREISRFPSPGCMENYSSLFIYFCFCLSNVLRLLESCGV